MRRFAFAIASILFACVAAAQNEDTINPDRPGIADGSTTVRRGVVQVETGVERDDSHDGGATQRDITTPTLLRIGISDAIELRFEGSGYEHTTPPPSNGWAPVSIGMKMHLQEENAAAHRPSLGVIGRLFVPSGTGDFRSDRVSGDVRLAADLDLSEQWAINPNLGVAWNGDERFAAALAALTVQYNFSSKLNAFVDGGLQAPEQRHGAASLLLDTGGAWVIGHRLQLDASIGWGAHGTTTPRVFCSAGISRMF